MSGRVLNALSVDVEDWFQVGAFETVIDRADWDGFDRASSATPTRCSSCSPSAESSATFFTLGWVAERHPALIRRIVDAGHEIASHGWDHAACLHDDAAAVPRRSGDARARCIEDAAGVAVTGYRAPSFSIDERTPWAHRCSPRRATAIRRASRRCVHDHYGWREAPRFAFRPVADAALIELPVTIAEFAGRRLAHRRRLLPPAARRAHRLRGPPGQRARRSRRSSISTRGRSIPASRASRTRRCGRSLRHYRGSARWRASSRPARAPRLGPRRRRGRARRVTHDRCSMRLSASAKRTCDARLRRRSRHSSRRHPAPTPFHLPAWSRAVAAGLRPARRAIWSPNAPTARSPVCCR